MNGGMGFIKTHIYVSFWGYPNLVSLVVKKGVQDLLEIGEQTLSQATIAWCPFTSPNTWGWPSVGYAGAHFECWSCFPGEIRCPSWWNQQFGNFQRGKNDTVVFVLDRRYTTYIIIYNYCMYVCINKWANALVPPTPFQGWRKKCADI